MFTLIILIKALYLMTIIGYLLILGKYWNICPPDQNPGYANDYSYPKVMQKE